MNIFELGEVVATNGVERIIKEDVFAYYECLECLNRHESGDWVDLCEEDKQVNENALLYGGRVMSAYTIGKNKDKIWIITEWDRSVTTILLPEEY